MCLPNPYIFKRPPREGMHDHVMVLNKGVPLESRHDSWSAETWKIRSVTERALPVLMIIGHSWCSLRLLYLIICSCINPMPSLANYGAVDRPAPLSRRGDR